MSSRIEQSIEDIEQYIDACPHQALSKSKIIVNKEEFMELLAELRLKTPEEIKRYQKMISNKEAILSKAQATAEEIIARAKFQTTELVNQHQIVQQAYDHAEEIIKNANEEANGILMQANEEAKLIREAAIQYTDDLLKGAEHVISNAIETAQARSDKLIAALGDSYETIRANRNELFPQEPVVETKEEAPQEPAENSSDINLMS